MLTSAVCSFSWQEIETHCRELSSTLRKIRSWEAIVCLARGGLIPGGLLSHFLDIRLIETLCFSSYDQNGTKKVLEVLKSFHSVSSSILVVDDLADTGETFMEVRKMLPNAHRACLYVKPRAISCVESYLLEIPQETWVVFPWETKSNPRGS